MAAARAATGRRRTRTQALFDRQTSRFPGMELRVTFGAFNDRLWSFALVFGGLSVVATMIATRSWRQFRDAVKAPLTPSNGDVPNQREWDFRYWRRIGLVTAALSILFSIIWLVP